MNWLAAYRSQLAEEKAGRGTRFRTALGALRLLWFVIAGIGFTYAMILIVSDLRNPYPGGGWSVVIGPVVVLVAVVIGAIPYKIGQLFLAAKADNDG